MIERTVHFFKGIFFIYKHLLFKKEGFNLFSHIDLKKLGDVI